ncbi:CAMK/RAD53 protein kinase [Cryptococcus neoformans Bt1]|nr:CAMK/RAD53 protein kinase [Cryptococcus neoformans var. grubii Bt1]
MSQTPSQQPPFSDDAFEPTQLSQPAYSQTQNTQTFISSQVEPRRKYWAIFISTHSDRGILKVPWSKPYIQLGRGPYTLGNDVILPEKRVSNTHCRFTLGMQGTKNLELANDITKAWKEGEGEPEVWVEDLKSSNGTFVNGARINTRRLLRHGDEISLGHAGTLDYHDVRYIYRSVGGKRLKNGQASSNSGDLEPVGQVYEKYQLLDRLGKGTFAEVHKAVDVETGNMRAIKQIVKHRFAGNDKTLQLFHREINITRSLEHENICRLIDWYEDPQHICLVLEYVDGGDLLDYIMNWPDEQGGLPEQHAAELTVQICRAMAYTHSKGITHRDLKPENILLTKEHEGARIVKIADFGLAKMIHTNTMLVSMVGTPQYLAPEIVMQTDQQPGYENVVDSWSVGIIVYSMMTKALPFDEDSKLPVEQRIRARFNQPPDVYLLEQRNVSQQAIDFILRLLDKDPAKRMTMAQALDHDWLSEPSSQPVESQRMGLGGDSMWSIQSFDSLQPEFNYGPGNTTDWQRPATVSGTRLESGIEGSDDFSQPMTKLHLNTPEVCNIPSQRASSKQTTGAAGINTPVSPLSPFVAGNPVNVVSPSVLASTSPASLSKQQKRKLEHEKRANSIGSEDEGLEDINRTNNDPVNENIDASIMKESAVDSVKEDGKGDIVLARRPRKSMRLQ